MSDNDTLDENAEWLSSGHAKTQTGGAWHFGITSKDWWPVFRDQESISLGWSEVDYDFDEPESIDTDGYGYNAPVVQTKKFARDMSPGDIIFGKEGRQYEKNGEWQGDGEIYAVGVVKSEYVYEKDEDWYDSLPESCRGQESHHHRKVEWVINFEETELGPFQPSVILQRCTLYDVDYDALKEQILDEYSLESEFERVETLSAVHHQSSNSAELGSERSFWIEKSEHSREDRKLDEWGVGDALWCPQTNKNGNKNIHYELVTEVEEGDVIFHLNQDDKTIVSASVADDSYSEATCVEGTRWDKIGVEEMGYDPGERPAYKVPLREYERFAEPLSIHTFLTEENKEQIDEIREENTVFYNVNLGLNQGAYLTEAPEELARLIDDTLQGEVGHRISNLGFSPRATPMEAQDDSIDDAQKESVTGIASLDFEIPSSLYFENGDEIRRQIEATINSGKNIIFTGPPGTGKTELASALGKTACDFDQVADTTFTTATADWTAFDTIGGHMPETNGGDGIAFQPRVFLRCFRDEAGITNEWLIIDEINRADIDKAFGQLFSVLSGDSVELPYEYKGEDVEIRWVDDEDGLRAVADNEAIFPVTPSWRLIATMNTYDKASLYEMSYAFMRRFNFIHVAVPTLDKDGAVETEHLNPDVDGNFADVWDFNGLLAEDDLYKHVSTLWYKINQHRKIGPSIVMDMLEYVDAYDSDRREEALTNALVSLLFPQMEGMRPETQKKLITSFGDSEETVGEESVTPRVTVKKLQSRAEDFFDIEFDEDD